MDSMAFSKKMLNSAKFKASQAALKYTYALLRNHLKIAVELTKQNEEMRKKGYAQYRTYSQNKRKDMITWIPCNPVQSHKMLGLVAEISKFFKWEKEHKNGP